MNVSSTLAPDTLEVYKGISVRGPNVQGDTEGMTEFIVGEIWTDTVFSVDIVEFTLSIEYTLVPEGVDMLENTIMSLISKDNRTNALPVASYYVKTSTEECTIFLDIDQTINFTEEDLKATYNGVTYTVSEMDPYSQVFTDIGYYLLGWAFGNVFLMETMPITKYLISPQATTGQEINYGLYNGEVVGYNVYSPDGTTDYDVIEVHHNEQNFTIDLFGTQNFYIGESTYYYEKETGIVVFWMEDNPTGDDYHFNATEIIIPPEPTDDQTTVDSAAIIGALSTVIVATIAIRKRRKKN
ncbi:MAG: hypothetical protein GOP50_08150 [Candidatus Heimdallarchaeota archaeon]|nr:hypothetical protein [Candidatus Heimdallarchaeota archaeon]